MNKNKDLKVIFVIAAASVLLVIIGFLITFFKKPKTEEPSTASFQVTEESVPSYEPDTENNSDLSDLSESESLFQQGALQVSDNAFNMVRERYKDCPAASDEEMKDTIDQTRNLYRQFRFSDGSNLVANYVCSHSLPDNLLARELYLLYSDSAMTGNLEAYEAEYGSEFYSSDAVKNIVDGIYDPETYLLAMMSYREGYKCYLEKDSFFLHGNYTLLSQGKALEKGEAHYTIAEEYITPTALYEFPVRFNEKYVYYAVLARDEKGLLYVLSVENEDGSYASPYEQETGFDESQFFRVYEEVEDEPTEEITEEIPEQ